MTSPSEHPVREGLSILALLAISTGLAVLIVWGMGGF